MSRLDDIKENFSFCMASQDPQDTLDEDDVKWLISEVERLQWFEERYRPYDHDGTCSECGRCCMPSHYADDITAFHKSGCEYIKHRAKE